LLGPNGAGKTTLIRAIAGRLSLDRGRILLFGRELTASDPRADLGVVPQELAIYPLLSARENLEVFGRLYGVTGKALADRLQPRPPARCIAS
jgi:ABC-2 type transport system ATP-binding protein